MIKQKEKLEMFRRYLVRQNFNGSMGYLKKNILRRFDELFKVVNKK